MSAPALFDFAGAHACARGTTHTARITWTDAAGAPVSLVGWTAVLVIRRGVDSPVALLECTAGNGRLIAEDPASAGVLVLQISAVDTAALSPGRYVYSLNLSREGEVIGLLAGAFWVIP